MKNPKLRKASFGFEQLPLLPESDFNPKWPKPATQAGITLTRMLNGERLTEPNYGNTRWRLAAYIKTLRYYGWPIQAKNVPRPAGFGTGRPIREYWFSRQIIEAVSSAKGLN